jgi:tetratricopeptide (TPR) repeat protein
MRYISNLIPAIIILLISSCTGSRQITEQTNMALDAYQTGNYTKALESAEQVIMNTVEKGKSAEGNIYAIAGKSTYQLGAYDKSRDYLISAREDGYSDEQMILFQADNYHRIDNLSKEITLLEEYIQKYPGGKYINSIRTRLFQTCLESENFELAKQYARLLKAFKIVTLDFKQSLDYYMRLYNLYPKPEYAKYLGNIYARLSDEKNAKYYHDKAL